MTDPTPLPPDRIRHMIGRLIDTGFLTNLEALLDVVDRVADLECCCPTHGGVVTHGSARWNQLAEEDQRKTYPDNLHVVLSANRIANEPAATVLPGCPGGDCDGCPDCLSGHARRIIVRLGGD